MYLHFTNSCSVILLLWKQGVAKLWKKDVAAEKYLSQSTPYDLLLTWGKNVDLCHTGALEETIALSFLCISDSFTSWWINTLVSMGKIPAQEVC